MMKSCITVLALLASCCSYGQQLLNIGQIDEIDSRILNEKRQLNVYLPENYATSQKKYPVVYLLDGSLNEDFLHIAGLVQFLTMIGKMPESIVIGIANVDRRRDFTYPTTIQKDKADFPTTGGSQNFIAFIAQELQPHVESHFRCNQSKTIIGQSLGGLLASEILLKNPQLFSHYLIVSPSFWWDDESLLKRAEWKKFAASDRKIYVAIGNEGTVMENDAKMFSEMLKRSVSNATNFMFNPMPAENHATILHNSAYEGLIFLNDTAKP